jgi:hypothetical protein
VARTHVTLRDLRREGSRPFEVAPRDGGSAPPARRIGVGDATPGKFDRRPSRTRARWPAGRPPVVNMHPQLSARGVRQFIMWMYKMRAVI